MVNEDEEKEPRSRRGFGDGTARWRCIRVVGGGRESGVGAATVETEECWWERSRKWKRGRRKEIGGGGILKLSEDEE